MRFATTAITLLCFVGWTLATQPEQGVYIIANQVPSFAGQLVVNFNGKGSPLSVSPRGSSVNEVWVLYKVGGNMSMTPLSEGDLEAAVGFQNRVTALPGFNKNLWNITSQLSGYTIQKPGETIYWGTTPIPFQSVIATHGSGVGAQRWDLIRVG